MQIDSRRRLLHEILPKQFVSTNIRSVAQVIGYLTFYPRTFTHVWNLSKYSTRKETFLRGLQEGCQPVLGSFPLEFTRGSGQSSVMGVAERISTQSQPRSTARGFLVFLLWDKLLSVSAIAGNCLALTHILAFVEVD